MSKLVSIFRSVVSRPLSLAIGVVALGHQAEAGLPPVSEADLITTRSDRQPVVMANLLQNDLDPDGTSLMITAVEPGVGGSVSLDLNRPNVVIFQPNATFSGVYTFRYEVTDGAGEKAFGNVTIRNPFMLGRGIHAGPIPASEFAPNSAGYAVVNVTSSGAFTFQIRVAGERLRTMGVFESGGSFSGDFQLTALERRRLDLTFPVSEDGGAIRGTYSGGAQTITFELPRIVFGGSNPAPFSGRYTVILPAPANGDLKLPGGHGYGVLRVSTTGNVKLAGKLPDASRFSESVFLNPDGTVPIYSSLYQDRGNVSGQLGFVPQGTFIRVQGNATWFKPKSRGDRFYPKGFTLGLQVDGSAYQEPRIGSAPLDVPAAGTGEGNAGLAISGLGLDSKPQRLDLLPRTDTGSYSMVPIGANRLKLAARIDLRSGYFVGTILEPKVKIPRRFSGVLVQGLNVGAGVIEGASKTGAVFLSPNITPTP